MKNYIVHLSFSVQADNLESAKEIGTGCYEHLFNTYNDNETLGQSYIVKAEKGASNV